MMIFFLSYFMHMLCECGMTTELITATFYKQEHEGKEGYNEQFNFANMQSILLSIACMYFVLGSTLEYLKNSEYIVTGLCLLTGLLKTYVRIIIYLHSIDRNLLYCFPILGSSKILRY